MQNNNNNNKMSLEMVTEEDRAQQSFLERERSKSSKTCAPLSPHSVSDGLPSSCFSFYTDSFERCIRDILKRKYSGVVDKPSNFEICRDNNLSYHGVVLPEITYSGSIRTIIGPMFSGKTSETQRHARRAMYAKKRVLFIKLDRDKRYSDDKVVTHDGLKQDALSCSRLKDAVRQSLDHDMICIDEGQFFPELVEFCDLMANVGKEVCVSMLKATYERTFFPKGDHMRLICISSEVEHLKAVCLGCGSDADNSALIKHSDRSLTKSNGELIGGSDTYRALCRKCYMLNLAKSNATTSS